MRALSLLPLVIATPALAQDFPVTLDHAFGSTTIPARPERVVSVGVHEQDFLYALGISPVGVHDWWGEKPYATWSWAEDERAALGAEPAVLMGFEINAEWVAAQNPDLIVASYYGDLTQAEYDLLSQIAPVITAPPGYPQWGAPWQAELRLIGQATGTSARAEEIVADLEGRIAAARAEYPMLQGKTGSTGYYYDGVVMTYNSADTAQRFLQDFGIVIPAEYDELAVERGNADFSMEQLSHIDLDLFIFPDEPAEGGPLAQVPTYAALGLATEGRAINLGGGDLAAALSFQTPLAIDWLVDVLPPMMAAAVDGDPATAVVLPE